MNRRTPLLLFASFLVFPSAVLLSAPDDDPVKDAVKPIREKYALDRRTAVFDVSWENVQGSLIVRGEVDNAAAREETISAIRKIVTTTVIDSIRVLPDPMLGEKTFGIVVVSVGNVRSKPGDAEELSTQVLMGMVVKVLKKQGGYYYVQSHDRYLGWLDSDAFHFTDRQGVDAWAAARKVIVTGYFGIVRESPDASSLPVCDIVIGNLLKGIDEADPWAHVELADGRRGYLDRTLVEDYDTWKRSRMLNGESVEKVAKMFIGIPYLWGGTSSKGMDCSGFTKTVYRLNGMELNRDANQQATMGVDIPVGDNFQNLKKGDLLFFGRKASAERPERISHVAIFLEKKLFIQSAGRVRFGSFDPASPYFDEGNTRRLVRARRVIPSADVPEVKQ